MNTKSLNWYPLVIIVLIALFAATFAALVLEKSKPKHALSQLAAGEPLAPAVSTQQYHWKMVTSWPKNTPGLGVGAENIARVINEMSGGRLQIHVYGANELVPAMGVFDAVSSGSVDRVDFSKYAAQRLCSAAHFAA